MNRKNLAFICLLFYLSVSCSKQEDPPVEIYEYHIVGRITPFEDDTNHYWPLVRCRLFISYVDYQSPLQAETEIVRANSLVYVHFSYQMAADRKIKSVSILFASDSLRYGPWYCRIPPCCNIDTTNFYFNDCCILQRQCLL